MHDITEKATDGEQMYWCHLLSDIPPSPDTDYHFSLQCDSISCYIPTFHVLCFLQSPLLLYETDGHTNEELSFREANQKMVESLL